MAGGGQQKSSSDYNSSSNNHIQEIDEEVRNDEDHETIEHGSPR